MRRYAIASLGLAVCIVAAIAKMASPTAQPAVTPPVAQAAVQSPAPEPTQPAAAIAAVPDTKPAELAAGQAAAEPVVQTAAIPATTPAAIPPAVIRPDAKPTDQPIIHASLQPEANTEDAAAVQSAVQPAALPAEAPAAEPVAKPPEKEAAVACPGHPDALGTSRVMTISPADYKLLGTMQYKQTLPLNDHEVVLTFDDGPIPPYTPAILDILASQCVRATYFLVGEMARPRPYLVRRIYNEGHSIGTHTQNHPLAIQHMSMQRVERQVDGGIDSVDAALGDPKALSPFFRIPGLGRTNAIESFLESKGLVTWSADIDTNDWWRGSSPSAIVQRAMRRLNARGRGILLMHDIHPATVMALPMLLKELKAQGYRIVHVEASGERPNALPELIATPSEKGNWPRVLRASSEKSGPAVSALRHRVKTALNHRPNRRVAQRKDAVQVDNPNDALSQRLTQF